MKRWVWIVLWCVSALLMTGLVGQSPPAQTEHAAVFTQDAVAADHAEASKAGAEILAAGGNAADAAAATMLALGVVNPASSGLGGGGFALYYCAEDGSLTFLDFRERAPRAATPTMFEL
ncbi:MAG: gamma-glutamyltransferase, partial [Deltaproteobacteria bacterium]|nr:gamma-glutamyltransferase [Deltaproteobacteria bacterium]